MGRQTKAQRCMDAVNAKLKERAEECRGRKKADGSRGSEGSAPSGAEIGLSSIQSSLRRAGHSEWMENTHVKTEQIRPFKFVIKTV